MNGRRLALSLPLLLVLLGSAYHAIKMGLSDLRFTRVETALSFWGRQNYRPDQAAVLRTQADVAAVLNTWPGNPDYNEAFAQLLSWQAYWEDDKGIADTFSGESLARRLEALERRPAHREAWLKLAEAKARLGQYDAQWDHAIERAQLLSPYKQ